VRPTYGSWPSRTLRRLGFALAVLVIVSPAILFFVWMVSLSLKNELDNSAYPPVLIPSEWAWDNYAAVFEQNPYSFAVRAAAIDVAVGIQDHPTSRRTIAARASHFRSHRRHRQRAQPESQPLDQRRALPPDPELWLEAAALNNETWWQDWTRCVADREEVPQTSRSRELELAGSRGCTRY